MTSASRFGDVLSFGFGCETLVMTYIEPLVGSLLLPILDKGATVS